MGATSTASGRLEVNLILSEKRVGKSHFGKMLVSAVLGIWRFCVASRSLLPISMQTKQDPIWSAAHKGVFNVSSLSTWEGSNGSSTTPRKWLSDKSKKRASEFVTRAPSKLAKQPNNRKIVAHIIIPRGNHTNRPCHWFSSMTVQYYYQLAPHARKSLATTTMQHKRSHK